MRYLIQLSYNGSFFHGWQIQPNAISVQQTLEEGLSLMLNEKAIKVIGASRTDTGVHAKEMYAHFDYTKLIDSQKLIFKLNSFFGDKIFIKKIRKVIPEFHSRFDAKSREYKYYITQKKDIFNIATKYYCKNNLDFEKIDLAIKIIKNTKNFESFCKSNSGVSNYECEIIDFYYEIDSSNIIFTIQANRFLRNMVRSIMGTIIEIGIGKTALDELKYIITKSNRIYAGPSLPAHALFLEKISYSKDIYL